MERDYEVIVAGAGPAGALTAALLAGLGRDVLLLDKSSFPRHKACGDALPAGVLDILVEAGLRNRVEEAYLSNQFYPVERLRLVSPRGHDLVSPLTTSKRGYRPCVTTRYYFDCLLQQHALEAGAAFRQLKVEKPLIEKGYVIGVEAGGESYSGPIRARVVVGADGVNSVLSRSLRNENRHSSVHRALALRAYLESIEITPHELEFYLLREILPGYAWIFPAGKGRVNVGLGMRLDYYRQRRVKLQDMLYDFLAMPRVARRLENGGKLVHVCSWPLNFGSQKKLQYAFNGALLVGDAAGFVNPLTGGGIHSSLISARLAAGVIDEALKSGDLSRAGLRQYEFLCRAAFLKDLRKAYHLQGFLMRFPFLLDLLAGRLNRNRILSRIFSGKF